MMRRLGLTPLVASLIVAPLTAQSADQRQMIDSAKAIYATLTPESQVAAFEQLTNASDPMARLQRGYLLLAIGERDSSTTVLLQAADEFYEVTVRRPKWVYGWFGLGRAKSLLAQTGVAEVRSPHQSPGMGWENAALQAFQRAARVDSTYTPATEALARAALQVERPPTDPEINAAIDRALAHDSADATLWILLGRSHRRGQRHRAALAAFEHAYALHPADSGVVSLELARELFATGQPERAGELYYRGAAATDSATRALYRHDIAYIATDPELAAFDSLPASRQVSWLEAFWTARERASGRPLGSRLPEHYRRWLFAQEHFRRPSSWARQSEFEMIYRAADIDLDDRGAVYMRHGEPDAITGYVGGRFTALNASWLYFRPEQNLVFHFVLGRGVTGWRMTGSFGGIGGGDPEAWASRIGFGPEYGRIAFELEMTLAQARARMRISGSTAEITSVAPEPRTVEVINRERLKTRRSIEIGMSTDSDPLRMRREFEPIVQVFGAGGISADSGHLVVAVSLPASKDLQPIPLPDGTTGYALRLRITAADDSGRVTVDSDSLIKVRVPHPLARGEHLSVVRTYDLAATGDQRVRLILTDTARVFGAVRVANGVPVPPLLPDRLVITDLVVGKLGTGAVWRRADGTTIALNPLNAWTRTETMEIGFELSGLDTGTPYKIRIAVGDLGADSTKPPRASVEFENVASGARELVTQSLGLRSLRPGRYLLTVTVAAGDRAIKRERRVTIVGAR